MAGAHVTRELRWTKALTPNFSAAGPAEKWCRASARCFHPLYADSARAAFFFPTAKMLSTLAPGESRLQDAKMASLLLTLNGVGSTFKESFSLLLKNGFSFLFLLRFFLSSFLPLVRCAPPGLGCLSRFPQSPVHKQRSPRYSHACACFPSGGRRESFCRAKEAGRRRVGISRNQKGKRKNERRDGGTDREWPLGIPSHSPPQ